MKKVLTAVLVFASALTFASAQGAQEGNAKSTETKTIYLKASHVFNVGHPVYDAFKESADLLYEKTNGRYGLTIYPAGTYANYSDSITACQMGDLDIACLDSATDWDPAAGVLFAPYCFQSYAHWDAFKNSDICTEMMDEISDAVGGIKQLNMYNFGFRNLTANFEVKGLKDFQGKTLRCVNFAPYSTLKDVFNVAITSIPIEDVYMSLQTGVADMEENPVSQIVTMKFYEVQKYCMKTQHMLACSSTIINKDLWDSLSDIDKNIFQEVFTRQGNRIDELTQANEDKLFDVCREHGMTIVNNVDTTEYRKNAQKVVEQYPEWKNYYDRIQALKY